MFKFSQKSLNKLSTVDARLQLLAKEVLKISKVDFGISYGLRTDTEQQEIYKTGASRCDGVINRSKHQDGKAFDFVCYINNKITFEKKYYYYIVGLMQVTASQLNININCGVWFKNLEDCGHIELA